MVCRKLSYYEEERGLEKSPLKILGAPEEKIQTSFFCNSYTPFGLQHAGGYNRATAKENKFLFNGVEKVDALGFDMYSTLFRLYDPAIGRFHQIDPLADFMTGINPYNFGFNNPISFADPTGLAPLWFLKLRANVKQAIYNVTGRGNKHAIINGKDKRGNPVEVGARTGSPRAAAKPSTSTPSNDPAPLLSMNTKMDVPEPDLGGKLSEPLDPVALKPRPKPKQRPSISQVDFRANDTREFKSQFHGGSNQFVSNKKTRTDLYIAARSLKHNKNLVIVIRSATNLTWFQAGTKSKVGGNLDGLLKLRSEAVKEALESMGVDSSQIRLDENPSYEKGHDFGVTFEKKN